MSIRGKLVSLLVSRPWLYPIAYHICRESDYMTPSDVAKRVGGVRTALVRRALWYFRKLGALEVSASAPLSFRVAPEWRKVLHDIVVDDVLVYEGGRMVVKRGKIYIYLVVRRGKIVARPVLEDVVEEVKDVLKRSQGEVFTVSSLRDATGRSLSEVSTATRILTMLGYVQRKKGGYVYPSS